MSDIKFFTPVSWRLSLALQHAVAPIVTQKRFVLSSSRKILYCQRYKTCLKMSYNLYGRD